LNGVVFCDVQIVRAIPEQAPTLTQIALAAKRHWGYADRWIEVWRDELTVLPEFIANHETYAATAEGRTVGFYALSGTADQLRLEHLWVLPEVMGQGIGRSLFAHARARAKALGYRALEIEADPNAEGFYRQMGAYRAGARVTELDGQCRELPILICLTIDAA
jgi:GNAT superfamily N-acetyltransferase